MHCRYSQTFVNKLDLEVISSSHYIVSSESQDLVDLRKFGRMPLAATYVDNLEEIVMTSTGVTLSRNGGQMDMFFMNSESLGDSSVINGFGTNNIEQMNSIHSTYKGSGHHTFPARHAYDDFFHFPNGTEGEEKFSGIGLYLSRQYFNYRSDQVSLDYGQAMPNQVSLWYLLVRGAMLSICY